MIMEFGSFDDDLFVEKDVAKRNNENAPYVPKAEYPQWYLDPVEQSDPERLRLQAYHFYHNGDFLKALEKFSLIYDKCDGSFRPAAEALESMARCCLHLEKNEEAVRHGKEYLKMARNYDNFIQAWNLLLNIYCKSGKYPEALEYLIRLAMEFNRNPDLWLQLQKLFEKSQSFVEISTFHFCSKCSEWIQVGSLIRAKTLLDRTYRTAVGFSKERNRLAQEAIDVQLDKLSQIHHGDLDRIRKFVAVDLLKPDETDEPSPSEEVKCDTEPVEVDFNKDVSLLYQQFFHQWFFWTDCCSLDCSLRALVK